MTPRDASAQRAADEVPDSVRVDLGDVDALLEDLTEMNLDLADLDHASDVLRRSRRTARRLLNGMTKTSTVYADRRHVKLLADLQDLAEELDESLALFGRTFDHGLGRVNRGLLEVRKQATELRLLPAGLIFSPLERAVRDVALTQNKRVTFQSCGGEYRLDSHALAALRVALLHVVRNCVAHGIEPEAERIASGKPPFGTVELAVRRQGNRIAFTCRDDGRGIDVDAVRRAAVRRGLVPLSDGGNMDEATATNLVLRAGVTTTEEVTGVAGRGIGLDVVRETVAKLKGEVNVRTEPGRGTTIEITVPVSLSSLPAILATAGGVTVAIPLDSVLAVRRVSDEETIRSGNGEAVVDGERSVALLDVSAIFAAGSARGPRPRRFSVVLIGWGAERIAARVESVGGIANVVVHQLPAWMAADPIVGGATLGPDGWPQIVLDGEGLVRAARSTSLPAPEPAVPRAPVLVVDDSLTTRMLEQSILESVGYDVDLATSGEDALVMARKRRYGAFLVDIEMPGMSGFEFIAQARADPFLRNVPAILVTSLNSDEDRKRGEDLGARGYIVKGEFDQGRLLATIRELAG